MWLSLMRTASNRTHAVIRSATHANGVLLEGAQSGRGLAGVQDRGARTAHGVDERTCSGGDAAKALEEIQRHPLAREHGGGRGFDDGRGFARGDARSLDNGLIELVGDAKLGVDLAHDRQPGDHGRFAIDKGDMQHGVGRHHGGGGQVARADVLSQRAPHGVPDGVGGDVHGTHTPIEPEEAAARRATDTEDERLM